MIKMTSQRGLFILGATGTLGQMCLKMMIQAGNDYLWGFSFHTNYRCAQQIIDDHAQTLKVVVVKDEKIKAKLLKLLRPEQTAKLTFYLESAYQNSQTDIYQQLLKVIPDNFMILILNYGLISAQLIVQALTKLQVILVIVANKELIVSFIWLWKTFSKNKQAQIIPLDSELNAFQALGLSNAVLKVYLPASGGIYRDLPLAKLNHIFYEHKVKHPVWKMGELINLNSATLLNKIYEMIWMKYYFDLNFNQIIVVWQRHAKIHALFFDKNQQLHLLASNPSMNAPLAQILNYDLKPAVSSQFVPTANFTLNGFFKPLVWQIKMINLTKTIIDQPHFEFLLYVINQILIKHYFAKVISFGQMVQSWLSLNWEFIWNNLSQKFPQLENLNDVYTYWYWADFLINNPNELLFLLKNNNE